MLTLILRGIHSNEWNTKSRKTEKKREKNQHNNLHYIFQYCNNNNKTEKKERRKAELSFRCFFFNSRASCPCPARLHVRVNADTRRGTSADINLFSQTLRRQGLQHQGNVSAPNLLMSLKISPKPLWSPWWISWINHDKCGFISVSGALRAFGTKNKILLLIILVRGAVQ